MLILTRKIGEKVFINNGSIQVTVLQSKGNSIRLGFTAPENMDVDREEIYLQKVLKTPEFLKAANA